MRVRDSSRCSFIAARGLLPTRRPQPHPVAIPPETSRASVTVRIAALLLAVALISGCENVNRDYFPLAEGNRWTYAVRGDEGKAGGVEVRGSVTLEITEKIRPLTFRAAYRDGEQVWSKEDGFLSMQDSAGRHYLLRLPPHTGYRWGEQDADGRTRYYEIEGREDIETPAGRFGGCVRVREEDRLGRERVFYWYAPDVGLVRRSRYFRGGEVFRAELVSFSLKPAEGPAVSAPSR